MFEDDVPPTLTLRTWLFGFGDGSYHTTSPRLFLHRVRHWAIGPLLGCSCSGPGIPGHRPSWLAGPDGSCFNSPWRIAYARETTRDRVRLARLEQACREAGIKVPLS